MKFRLYLRGLGVGLIFASFILMITNRLSSDKNVTPVETQSQTKGIIAFDRDNTKAESKSEQPGETQTLIQEIQTEEAAVTTEAETTQAAEQTQPETKEAVTKEPATKQPETKQTQPVTAVQTTAAPVQTKPVPTKVVGERHTYEAGTVVTIKIKDVYYGTQAADILYYAGVIDDRQAYVEYIAATGYANIIKEGVYQVTVGDTYENISKIITRTN